MIASKIASSPGHIKITLLLAAVTTLVAGCGSSADSDGRNAASTTASTSAAPSISPSRTPSRTPASAVETTRRKAIAAYLGMWQDFVVAGRTSDWDSPRLDDHASGDALLTLSRGLYADHYNGLVSKGQPTNQPTATSATPASAPKTVMISDCGDGSKWLTYKADTGELADDQPGGRRKITAEVKLHTDGSWRVTRFAVEGVGTC